MGWLQRPGPPTYTRPLHRTRRSLGGRAPKVTSGDLAVPPYRPPWVTCTEKQGRPGSFVPEPPSSAHWVERRLRDRASSPGGCVRALARSLRGFAGSAAGTTEDTGEGMGEGSQKRSRDVSSSKNSWPHPCEVQLPPRWGAGGRGEAGGMRALGSPCCLLLLLPFS